MTTQQRQVKKVDDDHKVCFSFQQKRQIISLSETATLADVKRIVIKKFLSDTFIHPDEVNDNGTIIFKTGYPLKRISMSTTDTARLVLPRNQRIEMMIVKDNENDNTSSKTRQDEKTKPSFSAATTGQQKETKSEQPINDSNHFDSVCKRFQIKRPRSDDIETRTTQEEWTCTRCTLLNKATDDVCVMCETRKSSNVDAKMTANDRTTDERDNLKSSRFKRFRADNEEQDSWACDQCTLLNKSNTDCCEVCNAQRPSNASGNCNHRDENVRNTDNCSSPPIGAVSADFGIRGPPPILPETITIVSLNVAGFQPSQAAPNGWDPMPAFRSIILKETPDVVALQEVPYQYGLVDTWLPGYVSVGIQSSHCENVMLLLKEEWASHSIRTTTLHGPAILANVEFSVPSTSSTTTTTTVMFGSCHLEPFTDGAAKRHLQIKEMLASCRAEQTIILAGDYNMRAAEDSKFEALGLKDAWKEFGSPWKQKNTWDSIDRTPKDASPGSGPHNQYHGAEAFQYACRFDRVYLQGEMIVEDFHLIANQPVTNPLHYLSDHFGMSTKIRINTQSEVRTL